MSQISQCRNAQNTAGREWNERAGKVTQNFRHFRNRLVTTSFHRDCEWIVPVGGSKHRIDHKVLIADSQCFQFAAGTSGFANAVASARVTITIVVIAGSLSARTVS